MLARVVSDNGYKIELIRPMREVPLRLGSKVEIEVKEDAGDLVKIFDNQLDEETQGRLIAQLKDAMEEHTEPKVSNK